MTRKLPKSKYKTTEPLGMNGTHNAKQARLDNNAGWNVRAWNGMEWSGMEWWMREL